LAVQGSHFSLDLDKLIYLLKKGYRPRAVLFINGVNDITKLLESPFEPQDTPAYVHSAFSWAFNVSFFNSRSTAFKRIRSSQSTLQHWVTEMGSKYRIFDLSQLPQTELDYIDIIHYSVKGNKALASAIIKRKAIE